MPRDDTAERLDQMRAEMPRTIRYAPGLLSEIATTAQDAIIDAGLPVYQRGRRLVRPASIEVPSSNGRRAVSAGFSDINQAGLVDLMGKACSWSRWDARTKKETPIDPPRPVAEILLSRFGDWGFPTVSGVITCPTLRPDFSLLSEPGYDEATRLYLMRDPSALGYAIPVNPNRESAVGALRFLDGLLDGFPFVAPIDRAIALSALITPVCRGAIAVAPLHAFCANAPGSGKSYLADTAAAIATGRACPAAAAGRDADETDKRLVGLLLSGAPIVSVDNANGELGSDLLCQAVERPVISLRRLGASDITEIETRATVFANGNGLRVRGDMTRRSLICDLDAEMERPELRKFDFDPVERVLSNRSKYIAACLTIVLAFVNSQTQLDLEPLASYGDYTRTVRGALVWLGQPDPVASMQKARDDDPDLGELRDVMTQWANLIGFDNESAAKALVRLADRKAQDDAGRQLPEYENAELRDSLLAVAGGRAGAIDAARFGRWLREKKGRIAVVSGSTPKRARFESIGTTGGSARWRLRRV